jgi:hypothetical protein
MTVSGSLRRTRQAEPGGEQAANSPAINQHRPIRNDSKRQGRKHDHSIAAGHGTAVLVFTRQRSRITTLPILVATGGKS